MSVLAAKRRSAARVLAASAESVSAERFGQLDQAVRPGLVLAMEIRTCGEEEVARRRAAMDPLSRNSVTPSARDSEHCGSRAQLGQRPSG